MQVGLHFVTEGSFVFIFFCGIRFFPNCRYGSACAFAHGSPSHVPSGMPSGAHSPEQGSPEQGTFYYPQAPMYGMPNGQVSPHDLKNGQPPMEYAYPPHQAFSPGPPPPHAYYPPPPGPYGRGGFLPYPQAPYGFMPGMPQQQHSSPPMAVGPDGSMLPQHRASPVPSDNAASLPTSPLPHSPNALAQSQMLHAAPFTPQSPALPTAPHTSPPLSTQSFSSVAASLQTPAVAQNQMEAAVPISTAVHRSAPISTSDPNTRGLSASQPPSQQRASSNESSTNVANSRNTKSNTNTTNTNTNSPSMTASLNRRPLPSNLPRTNPGPRNQLNKQRPHIACAFFHSNACRNGDACAYAHTLADGTDAKAQGRDIIGVNGSVGDSAVLDEFKRSEGRRKTYLAQNGQPVFNRPRPTAASINDQLTRSTIRSSVNQSAVQTKDGINPNASEEFPALRSGGTSPSTSSAAQPAAEPTAAPAPVAAPVAARADVAPKIASSWASAAARGACHPAPIRNRSTHPRAGSKSRDAAVSTETDSAEPAPAAAAAATEEAAPTAA